MKRLVAILAFSMCVGCAGSDDGRCAQECGFVDGCVAINGHQWNEERACFEEAFAACAVPQFEPEVVPPLVDPDGDCWAPNWNGNPGWPKAGTGSPCNDLPSDYCE